MIDDRHELIPVSPDTNTGLRNKTVNVPAIRTGQDDASDYVSHLTSADVRLVVIVAGRDLRHGKRNADLITLIFDVALRVSETLGIRPIDIIQDNTGYAVRIMGKGSTPGIAAITPVLRHSGAIARLKASGNPKSVQHQLRHKSAQMTLRYMKTMSADESLVIQHGVNSCK